MIALACLSGTGCILLMPADDFSTTCHFEGMDTACGACIASHCQAKVNACCSDSACTAPGSTLGLVESCASGHKESCTLIPDDIQAAAASRVNLARCAYDECNDTCQGAAATSSTNCSVPEFGLGKTCKCTVEPPTKTNLVACSEAKFKGTKCCAPAGYPAQGFQCMCNVLACVATGAICGCNLYDSQTGSTSNECGGGVGLHCCQAYDNCMCSNEPCGSTAKEVKVCNLNVIDCPVNETEVSDCAVSK
jgi:hypothetical protein